MNYAVGSLVRARGREWVVLPDSAEEFLVLRPLGGTEEEIAGVHLSLESVEPAHFDLPDPSQVGDHRSCRLLRDAVRLGFRSSAGPFRSFGRLGIEPRPYQVVPLLMALKLDPVRLLIADDVGIGKTIEACLIARELYDRGEVQRIAVLCPPQLAEQWQSELRTKFHIEAELGLPGTATRLERNCRLGQSLFDLYPFVIVSTDFIKSDRRQDEFLRSCPELVIVDEAHSCSSGSEGRGGRHQRHQLLCGLAGKPDRHLLLVTATPHSGNEQAFRSLLKILKSEFSDLPEDLTGKENELHRRRLAAHLVQRRRADIRYFLKSETPFPEREAAEESYKLSEDYRKLFTKVLEYAREVVTAPGSSKHRQRVQWWSVLALLRALASSPAAAAATLRTRAATLDTTTAEEADDLGKRTVLDLLDDEAAETMDVTPGSISDDDQTPSTGTHGRLLKLAAEAENLKGPGDVKLQRAIHIVETLLRDGYLPIVFCRFVQTAEYVAAALRQSLRGNVEVVAVTGELPPAEREERVAELAKHPKHVLVATDCLSEGINLQQHFSAVLHYDLSWNPTRHEQREGRVDRYGQPSSQVRMVTLYGIDNQVDGIVLDVLIRKHKTIRSSLGISVPVPVDTEQVIEAIFEGLLLRQRPGTDSQQLLSGFEQYFRPQKEKLFLQWETSAEREKRSRTMFVQEGLSAHVEEVEQELKAARTAVGSSTDVARFTKEAFRIHKGLISENGAVNFDLTECPRALRETTGGEARFKARFEQPVPTEVLHLTRTHPVVEGLASFVMDTALDTLQPGMARRCGAIRTGCVSRRTTLLLLRLRFHILSRRGEVEVPLLAEDCRTIAFAGSPQSAAWLDNGIAEDLLLAEPDANIHPDQASSFVRTVVEAFDALQPRLEQLAYERSNELLEAHTRVRAAAGLKGIRYRVEPHFPLDVLGLYVYLPKLWLVSMQTRQRNIFLTIHTEGSILPPDLLQRIEGGDRDLKGLAAEDYHLAGGERLNEAVSRSWNRLVGVWTSFKPIHEQRSPSDANTTGTRERWLLPLFQELGYGRLIAAKAVEIDGKTYPISHHWQQTPLHLVGSGVDLDKRTSGIAGAARISPHGLLQEFLNRSEKSLWGFVSNGLQLRILRDNKSLTRQAYVEFDLEAMMNGEAYSDFVLLWLLCHQSRVEAHLPEECWLEKWSKAAQDQGTRALEQLRKGVEEAIKALGAAFLSHRTNRDLIKKLRSGKLSGQDYYRQLLRLVYRFIFLFVAEDRGLLLDPEADPTAKERYSRFYSLCRLRRLAQRRMGTRHADLYQGMRMVMEKLESGCSQLGLPALGGFLFSGKALPNLEGCEISNADLLDAIRALAFITDGHGRHLVDYKNLRSEELGSVYEALLELHPVFNSDVGTFDLKTASGHERKKTGSYYTPESLVRCLLDLALDPVVDEAASSPR